MTALVAVQATFTNEVAKACREIITCVRIVIASQDTVIQICATAFGEYATAVALKGGLIGLHGNRHSLQVDGTHQTICTTDINIASDTSLWDCFLEGALACAITSGVWVQTFRCSIDCLVVIQTTIERESPATATLALVLRLGDGTFGLYCVCCVLSVFRAHRCAAGCCFEHFARGMPIARYAPLRNVCAQSGAVHNV